MRRITLFVVAAMALAVVAGCSSGDKEAEEKTSRAECALTKAKPPKSLTKKDLYCNGVDLQGKTLEDMSLSNGKFADVDFEDAKLTDVNLSGADLKGADFHDAVLTGVDLAGADLTEADFTGATLLAVDLVDATRCKTVRTNGSIDNLSCGGNENETPQPAAPRPSPSPGAGVGVTSFIMAETITCTAGEKTAAAAVRWTTTGAVSASFMVDGKVQAPTSTLGSAPNGSGAAPFPCDGKAHLYDITAQAADGARNTHYRHVWPGKAKPAPAPPPASTTTTTTAATTTTTQPSPTPTPTNTP